jgi:hypothetical protein
LSCQAFSTRSVHGRFTRFVAISLRRSHFGRWSLRPVISKARTFWAPPNLVCLISKLDDEIKAINSRQDRRKREAYTQIANLTLDFLRRDTGTQDDFVDPKHLKFSFADDAVFVDGKSNFAASSLVILKNSFHLAMLIASLNDSNFALPRFMMFDNIEDKGMRPDRSHNFQSLIVNASLAAPTKHQIIFTTSMLSPDLRESPYLVGSEYSKQNKTLNIR